MQSLAAQANVTEFASVTLLLTCLILWGGGGVWREGIVISLPFIACFDKIYLSYTPSPLFLSLNSLSFPPPSFRNELTRKSAKFEFLLNGPRPRHQRLENKRHFSHTHTHPHTGSWHHRELWGFVIDAVNKNRETIVAVSVLEVLSGAFKNDVILYKWLMKWPLHRLNYQWQTSIHFHLQMVGKYDVIFSRLCKNLKSLSVLNILCVKSIQWLKSKKYGPIYDKKKCIANMFKLSCPL